MRKGILFIIGGIRSGKSNYAVQRACRVSRTDVAFVATAYRNNDSQMQKRIALHKKTRPSAWTVYEGYRDLAQLLQNINGQYKVIIVDCIALWVSGLLCTKKSEVQIEQKTKALCTVLQEMKGTIIIVSNEVGQGIIPLNRLARQFCDVLGRVNQKIARVADEVRVMHVGIPMRIKN